MISSKPLIACLLSVSLSFSFIAASAASDEDLWQEKIKTGKKAFNSGQFNDALKCFSEAVGIAKKFKTVDERLALSYYNLAGTYDEQDNFEEALIASQLALALREKLAPHGSALVATSLNDSALIMCHMKHYAEAEKLYRRSIAMKEKYEGLESASIGTSLANLAEMKRMEGKYDEAERLFSQALANYSKTMPVTHPATAVALNNLASLYIMRGKYAEAERLYLQTKSDLEKAIGSDHPDIAKICDRLGILYTMEARYSEAENYCQHSLAIYEKSSGPASNSTAISLTNLSRVFVQEGKLDQADALSQRALAILTNNPKSDQVMMAMVLQVQAKIASCRKQFSKAEDLCTQDLTIKEKLLGANKGGAGTILMLAEIYREEQKFDKAEPLYKRALTIADNASTSQNLEVALILNNLALLYSAQKKYSLASPLFERSLHIREKACGPFNLLVAQSLQNYAQLLLQTNHKEESEKFQSRATYIENKEKKADSPDNQSAGH